MDLWETVSYRCAAVLSTLKVVRSLWQDDTELSEIIEGMTTVYFTADTPPDTLGMDAVLESIGQDPVLQAMVRPIKTALVVTLQDFVADNKKLGLTQDTETVLARMLVHRSNIDAFNAQVLAAHGVRVNEEFVCGDFLMRKSDALEHQGGEKAWNLNREHIASFMIHVMLSRSNKGQVLLRPHRKVPEEPV